MDGREKLRDEFSSLIDNELDAETRATLEAGLADSAELLRELHGMKQVADLYAALPPVAAPPDFEAKTRLRMARQRWRSRMRETARRMWIPAAVAAAAFYVVATGLYLSRSVERAGTIQTAQEKNVHGSTPSPVESSVSRSDARLPHESPKPAVSKAAELGEAKAASGTAPATSSSAVAPFTASEGMDGNTARETPPVAPASIPAGQESIMSEANSDLSAKREVPSMPVQEPYRNTEENIKNDNKKSKKSQSNLGVPAAPEVAVSSLPLAEERSAPAPAALSVAAADMPQDSPEKSESSSEQGSAAPRILSPAPPAKGIARTLAGKSSAAESQESTQDEAYFEVLGQRFVFREGRWTASHYAGEVLTPLSEEALRTLLEQSDKAITDILLKHRPVIFQFQDTWYQLSAEATP